MSPVLVGVGGGGGGFRQGLDKDIVQGHWTWTLYMDIVHGH